MQQIQDCYGERPPPDLHNQWLMKATWFLPALLVLAGCGAPKNDIGVPSSPGPTASSAAPKFSDFVVTDDETTRTPKKSFATDAAKVIVYFNMDNVNAGSKLHATFVAEKAEGVRPNFKFKEMELDVPEMGSGGNFSLDKPPAGWPVGDFRMDLSLNGKLVESVKFSFAKQ